MAVRIVKFSDVPSGSQFFKQEGKDWESYRKIDTAHAQRETQLLRVAIGEPIALAPSTKVKFID